ncbi:MAG: flagellar basal-body rod protein FlgG [Planctomycetota bacterium]
MIRAMRTAASGMLAQQMLVDSLANNIANANTAGFKRDTVAFRSLLYRTYRDPGALTGANYASPTGLQIGSGVEVGSSIKQHLQGDMDATGNELDMAIQGPGFFQVSLGNGEFRYTRDGSFRRDANGAVVTVDGFYIEPRITIPEGYTNITVGADGTISGTSSGGTSEKFDEVRIHVIPNPAGLKAVGGNLFQVTASSGQAVPRTPGFEGAGFIRQGALERSNVLVVEELIELIQAQRNYEVNSRTIRIGDEMLQQVSQLIQ